MSTVWEQVNQTATEADRRATFRQLRRDLRYLARCMRQMDAVQGIGRDWDIANHTLRDCERRLHQRYDYDLLYRMKGIVVRTYRVRSIP